MFGLTIKTIKCFFLLVVLVLLLGACGGSGSSGEDEAAEELSVSARINVVDESGFVVNGVTATSDTFIIENQQYNLSNQLEMEIESATEGGIIKLQRDGYEAALVFFETMLSSSLQTVRLRERLSAIPVDAQIGGEFSGINGAKVNIPAGSLVLPDGTVASGEISLYMNTVDISDPVQLASFPGSFQGLASADTEPGILASLGVTSYTFEQNGEKLQLQAGEEAELVLPLYADEYPDGSPIPLGDLIPMWRLNETTGVWEEESTGVVVELSTSPTGLGLQATTSHFSSFNADMWGSPLGSPLAGPRRQTRSLPELCEVTTTVPSFEAATMYTAKAAQNLGGLVASRPMVGVYYEPFTFRVFRGRPVALSIFEPNYSNKEGRSTIERFTCNSNTLSLTVTFDDSPAFLGAEVKVEPIFTIENGLQTITSNALIPKAIFINDKDNLAELTSNIGVTDVLASEISTAFQYFPSDPSPASFAFYLENDTGTADTQVSVDYISAQAPTLQAAFAYKFGDRTVFEWEQLDGADSVDIIRASDLAVIVSDLDGTLSEAFWDTTVALESGKYFMEFANQYGSTVVVVELNADTDGGCIPNSDMPCNPN